MTYGTRIKQAREALRMTQEQLAEELDISRQAVSKWEADLSRPARETLEKLSGDLDRERRRAGGRRPASRRRPALENRRRRAGGGLRGAGGRAGGDALPSPARAHSRRARSIACAGGPSG